MSQIVFAFFFYLLSLTLTSPSQAAEAESSTEVEQGNSNSFEAVYAMNGISFIAAPVNIEDYPFVISIMHSYDYISSAALISGRWAVTRAYVLAGMKRTGQDYSAIIVAGATYPDELMFCPHNKKKAIDEIFIHEKYDAAKKTHDIGMVRLADDLKPTIAVQPVQFATRHTTKDLDLPEQYDDCRILGNFMLPTTIGGAKFHTRFLHQVTLTPIPVDECKRRWSGKDSAAIGSDFECTAPSSIMDFHGPWGGPLVCGSPGRYIMQGLRADFFGDRNGSVMGSSLPIVFTRIDKHYGWLRTMMSSTASAGAFRAITEVVHLVMIVAALMCYL